MNNRALDEAEIEAHAAAEFLDRGDTVRGEERLELASAWAQIAIAHELRELREFVEGGAREGAISIRIQE